MQTYELMVIIENSLDEKTAETHYKDLNSRLEKEFGAHVGFKDFWGARGFAYIIKKQKWGYYAVSQFEMDGSHITELKRELNLDQKLVRFLLMKVDQRAPAPKPYQEIKAEYEAQEKAKAKEKSEPKEDTPKPGKKEKLTTVKAEEPKAEAQKAEEPKDDVDKKLDAIVDESTENL